MSYKVFVYATATLDIPDDLAKTSEEADKVARLSYLGFGDENGVVAQTIRTVVTESVNETTQKVTPTTFKAH